MFFKKKKKTHVFNGKEKYQKIKNMNTETKRIEKIVNRLENEGYIKLFLSILTNPINENGYKGDLIGIFAEEIMALPDQGMKDLQKAARTAHIAEIITKTHSFSRNELEIIIILIIEKYKERLEKNKDEICKLL